MNDEIARIPFTLDDPGRALVHSGEAAVGALVVRAIVQALNLPVAALIGGVIMTVSQAAIAIQIELQDLRVAKRIELQDVTARRINAMLAIGRWKRHLGFYADGAGETFAAYSIYTNQVTSEEA